MTKVCTMSYKIVIYQIFQQIFARPTRGWPIKGCPSVSRSFCHVWLPLPHLLVIMILMILTDTESPYKMDTNRVFYDPPTHNKACMFYLKAKTLLVDLMPIFISFCTALNSPLFKVLWILML